MTPVEAARGFHNDNPHASQQDAERYADDHFAESSGVREFMTSWRKIRDFADQAKRAAFMDDVDRIWKD